MHTVLDLTLALKEIPAAAKSFFNARSSTSIKDVGAIPADPITNFRPLFLFPPQQTMPALYQLRPRPVLSSHRGEQMATAAQAPASPTTTDPVQSWLERRAAVN